jgi:Cdc6-like AAA superfamily ATPase
MASESLSPEVQDTPSVYICYSRSDADFVQKLNEVLQKHSIRTWIDSEDVDPGVKRNMSDFSGIDETSTFLFVVSPDAVASEWCRAELNYAFERSKDIVPVVRRAVDSESEPTQLASLQPIYFRAEDDPYEAFQTLVRAIDPDVAMDVDSESIRSEFRRSEPSSPEPPRPEPPRSSSVPTHPDRPTQIDLLERQAFAEALAVRIRGRNQRETYSFMVHIYGPWGSGKSTLLDFLGEELKKESEDQPPWLVISFNAWQHQHIGQPWWWLLDSVFRQGRRQLWTIHQNRMRALWLTVQEYSWRFLRAGRAPYVVALALVFGSIWLAGSLGLSGSGPTQGDSSTWIASMIGVIWKNIEGISGILTVLTVGWALILGVSRSLLPASTQAAETFLQSTRDPMRTLQRHFCRLVHRLKNPVAIFIDDLDRCQGDYVVDLLEGIQTLFSEPPVVYVVAADRRWVNTSYERRYENFASQVNEPGRSLGYLFLQKTFQFATPVPTMEPRLKRDYWQYLIGVRQSGDQDKLEEKLKEQRHKAREELRSRNTQEEIQEVLAQSNASDPTTQQAYREEAAIRFGAAEVEAHTEHVLSDFAGLLESNPRAMKRLVNSYGVRRTIALLVGSKTDWKHLTLYTILDLRWPLLVEYLMENPEMIRYVGPDPLPPTVPESLRELFHDQDVLDVIRGKGVGTSLNEAAMRDLAGMLPGTSKTESLTQ